MRTCDRRSVGIIVTDPDDRFLLLTRAKPPVGRAPIAGHVDDHDSSLAAARAEASEEAGIKLPELKLVADGFVGNVCRRPVELRLGPRGHHWWIYRASIARGSAVLWSEDETLGGDWYTREQVQSLSTRTVRWCDGRISDEDYRADPGLEPVWVHWLGRLGAVSLFARGFQVVEEKFSATEQI